MKGTKPKNLTLHDIAQRANVSYATVSRVLNGHPQVAEETRRRVLAVVKELNFVPNQAARSLIKGRTKWIQLVVVNYAGVRFYELFSVLFNHGYRGGVTLLGTSTATKEQLFRIMSEVAAGMVDGILLLEPEVSFTYEEMVAVCRGKPFVQIGSNPDPSAPSVVYDQKFGTTLALQHLINLGHRRIVEVAGIQSIYDGHARHETYLEVMQAYNLPVLSMLGGDFSPAAGYQKACELLASGEQFTAAFCANDLTAVGFIHALYDHGLRVPQDVSVVGFDDYEPLSAHMCPPLTTIRQDCKLLYQQGVQYLLSCIENPDTPRVRQVLYPTLIVRQSTKAVADNR